MRTKVGLLTEVLCTREGDQKMYQSKKKRNKNYSNNSLNITNILILSLFSFLFPLPLPSLFCNLNISLILIFHELIFFSLGSRIINFWRFDNLQAWIYNPNLWMQYSFYFQDSTGMSEFSFIQWGKIRWYISRKYFFFKRFFCF